MAKGLGDSDYRHPLICARVLQQCLLHGGGVRIAGEMEGLMGGR